MDEKKEVKKSRTRHHKQTDVFNNVEYMVITQNKRQLLVIEDNDINGKSKTDIQKYIGEKLGAGNFNFSLKMKGEAKNISGSIRGLLINKGALPLPGENNNRIDALENKIDSLFERLGKDTGTDFNVLLSMKDAMYKMQIDFYKERIDQLEKIIKEYEQESGGSSNDLINNLIQAFLASKVKA